MAQVVFLRGVNVGGHRTFRPAALAVDLRHLDVVNIGAAGTFVIRKPIGRTALRREFASRLPFETGIVICSGREIVRLMEHEAFAAPPGGPDEVRFVSVLLRPCRSAPELPIRQPATGRWLLQVRARDGRCVLGIRYLGTLDRLFGVPVTTRNWNTIVAIAKVLGKPADRLP
jgi:uncharacterized protein (DUF1697 family)